MKGLTLPVLPCMIPRLIPLLLLLAPSVAFGQTEKIHIQLDQIAANDSWIGETENKLKKAFIQLEMEELSAELNSAYDQQLQSYKVLAKQLLHKGRMAVLEKRLEKVIVEGPKEKGGSNEASAANVNSLEATKKQIGLIQKSLPKGWHKERSDLILIQGN